MSNKKQRVLADGPISWLSADTRYVVATFLGPADLQSVVLVSSNWNQLKSRGVVKLRHARAVDKHCTPNQPKEAYPLTMYLFGNLHDLVGRSPLPSKLARANSVDRQLFSSKYIAWSVCRWPVTYLLPTMAALATNPFEIDPFDGSNWKGVAWLEPFRDRVIRFADDISLEEFKRLWCEEGMGATTKEQAEKARLERLVRLGIGPYQHPPDFWQ